MNMTIRTIPHANQRYDTPGDWTFDGEGNLSIWVSSLGDWKVEALMAVHELVEVLICKHRGISQESVDAFDIQFEKDRKSGLHGEHDEPGDDRRAPYCREHCFACGVERQLASVLEVDWNKYVDAVEALEQ